MNAPPFRPLRVDLRALLSGPLLALATVAAVELLSQTIFSIPNPPAILLLVVVFSAFTGGLRPALLSAALVWLYFAYFFSIPGQPFRYTSENLARVLVWAVATPTMALMVGVLKQRAERAATMAREATLLRLSQTLLGEVNTQTILDSSIAVVAEVFRPDLCEISLLDATGEHLRLSARQGWNPGLVGRATLPAGADSLAGYTLVAKHPLTVEEASPEGRFRPPPLHAEHGVVSGLSTPMLVGERAIGVLGVHWRSPRRFGDDESHLLSLIANMTAQTLERASLLGETRRRAAEFAALYDTARDLAGQQDLATLLQTILERATSLLAAPCGELFLYDPVRGDLELVINKNSPAALGRRIALGEGMAGRVAQTLQPLMVNDYQSWEHRLPDYAGHPFTATIEVPMLYGGELIGVLDISEVGDAARKFTPNEVDLLTLFAGLAASAVHNARLLETEREQRELTEALREANAALSATLNPEAVLDRLLEQIVRVVPYDAANIYLIEDGRIRVVRQRGYEQFGARVAADTSRLSLKVAETPNLGRMAETGKPLIVSDTAADPTWVTVEATAHLRSWAGAPILIDGRAVAFLSLDKIEPGFYRPVHAGRLAAFAGQAALALQNARLFIQTQRHEAELAMLLDVMRAVSSSLDPEEVFRLVAVSLIRILQMNQCSLSVYEPEARAVRTVTGYSRDGALDVQDRFASYPLADYPATARVLETHVPLILRVGDPAADPTEVGLLREAGSKVLVMFSLHNGGRPVGLAELYTTDEQHEFTPEQLHLAQALADQVGAAIENARLFADARAKTAELSRLYAAAHDMTASLDMQVVLQQLARHITEAVDATSGYVEEIDQENAHLTVLAEYWTEMAAPAERVSDLGRRYLLQDYPTTARALAEQRVTTLQVDHPDLPESERGQLIQYGVKSALLVPLVTRGQLVGTAEIWESRRSRSFTPAEQRLAQTLAGHAAGIIQNARLFAETADTLAREQRLNEVARLISSSLDFSAVLSSIVRLAAELVGAEAGAMALVAPDGQSLLHPYLFNLPEGAGLEEPIPRGQGIAWQVVETGKAIRLADYAAHPHALSRWAAVGLRDFIEVPLVAGETRLGILGLYMRTLPRRFTDRDLALAESVGRQAGVAIRNAQLYDEARRRAEELEALVQVSSSLRQAATRQAMLPLLVEKTVEALQADSGALLLLETREGEARLVLAAARGPGEAWLEQAHPPDHDPVWQVLHTGEPLFISNFGQQPEAQAWTVSGQLMRGMVACAYIPLNTAEGTIGLLHLACRYPRSPTPVEHRLLTAIAEMAGNALHRAGIMETLEQRVAERTAELTAANERLQELDRLKDQFVANVSHDLRTPLTNIRLYLGLLKKRGVKELDRALPVLQRETERLTHLIEGLLILSRLEQGRMPFEPEPYVLDALITEVLQVHSVQAETKGLHVIHEPNPDVPAILVDHAQMMQVFNNLIGNAVAYTPPGGQVECRVALAPDQQIVIAVSNTGPTIPPEDLPHLFERFFRGRTGRESGEHGTGLGLAICREIVGRHGGKIEAESWEGRGTTFRVWLPQV